MNPAIYKQLPKLKRLLGSNSRELEIFSNLPEGLLPYSGSFVENDLQHFTVDKDGLYRYRDKIILPITHAFFYITACHSSLCPAWFIRDEDTPRRHLDYKETTMLMSNIFWWPGLDKDLQYFCLRCQNCYEEKLSTSTVRSMVDLGREQLIDRNFHPNPATRKKLNAGGLSGTAVPRVGEIAGYTEKALENFPDFSWATIEIFFISVIDNIRCVCLEISLQNAYLHKRDTDAMCLDWNQGSFEDIADYPSYVKKFSFDKPVFENEKLLEFLDYMDIEPNLQTFIILNKIMKLLHVHFWRVSILEYRGYTTTRESPKFCVQTLGPYDLCVGGMPYPQAYILVVLCLDNNELFAKFVMDKDHLKSTLWSGVKRVRRNVAKIYVSKDDVLNTSTVHTCCDLLQIKLVQHDIIKHYLRFFSNIIDRYVLIGQNLVYYNTFHIADHITNIVSLFNHTVILGHKHTVSLPRQLQQTTQK